MSDELTPFAPSEVSTIKDLGEERPMTFIARVQVGTRMSPQRDMESAGFTEPVKQFVVRYHPLDHIKGWEEPYYQEAAPLYDKDGKPVSAQARYGKLRAAFKAVGFDPHASSPDGKVFRVERRRFPFSTPMTSRDGTRKIDSWSVVVPVEYLPNGYTHAGELPVRAGRAAQPMPDLPSFDAPASAGDVVEWKIQVATVLDGVPATDQEEIEMQLDLLPANPYTMQCRQEAVQGILLKRLLGEGAITVENDIIRVSNP